MRLPNKKKPGDPVLATDWNMLLDAIAARTPRHGPGLRLIASSGGFAYSMTPTSPQAQAGYDHPFRLSVTYDAEAIRLWVGFGAATAMTWVDGNSTPTAVEHPLKFSSSHSLLNDPFSTGDVGFATLHPDTDYGVWMLIGGAASVVANNTGANSDFSSIQQYAFTTVNSRVELSTTATEPSSQYPYSEHDVPVFLGRVRVNADGVATISQYRRSDITLGLSDLPRGIRHPEAIG